MKSSGTKFCHIFYSVLKDKQIVVYGVLDNMPALITYNIRGEASHIDFVHEKRHMDDVLLETPPPLRNVTHFFRYLFCRL